MASIRRHKSSAAWYACITLPDGRRKQFSTGLTDRTEALAAATAAERALRRNREQPQALRVALERIADDYATEIVTEPAEWIRGWAAARAPETSPSTAATYRHMAREAAEFFQTRGIRSLQSVTPAVVTALRDHWATGNAPRTVNLKLKVLRIALASAVPSLIASNPAAGVGAVRAGSVARREFRPAELQVLLPSLAGEWRGIVFLGLYTGQRLNDLAVLRWHQVDLAAGTITLTTAKTRALVALPLMPAAVAALAELPAGDDPREPVFPGIAAMAPSSRSNRFRSILAGVGLAEPVRHTRRPEERKPGRREGTELSFHSLRHTATSMLKSAGVSDAIARAIIGHESAAVSRAYTHLDLDTMREAMARMPSL